MRNIKIIAEASIPYLKGVIEGLGEVVYLPSEDITSERVESADWLIVRSITKCDRALLRGSQVQLITTATIGFDHIDAEYCEEEGIEWRNAPGCNAEAVGQYFGASMALLYKETGFEPKGKTLGIIGVGHVGSVVERFAKALGMNVLRNDPPRARKEGEDGFVSLQKIADEADIITLHVPLTHEGVDSTYHLCDKAFISGLKKRPILINACRGGVTDTEALLWGLEEGKVDKIIIDCWEHEPNISSDLLAKAWLGTPHIAGFSAQGKANGARVCVENGIKFFGLRSKAYEAMYPPKLADPLLSLSHSEHPLFDAIGQTLDLRAVDNLLRANKQNFEAQRRSYHYPYEPNAYEVSREEMGLYSNSAALIGFKLR